MHREEPRGLWRVQGEGCFQLWSHRRGQGRQYEGAVGFGFAGEELQPPDHILASGDKPGICMEDLQGFVPELQGLNHSGASRYELHSEGAPQRGQQPPAAQLEGSPRGWLNAGQGWDAGQRTVDRDTLSCQSLIQNEAAVLHAGRLQHALGHVLCQALLGLLLHEPCHEVHPHAEVVEVLPRPAEKWFLALPRHHLPQICRLLRSGCGPAPALHRPPQTCGVGAAHGV
mmetsp:Transcript_129119/g.306329  ORF Transcript_129119/g.306329 Transcript_129119/m.306329 type:complete len:228 (-) Transcript_129119:531-1214(-)